MAYNLWNKCLLCYEEFIGENCPECFPDEYAAELEFKAENFKKTKNEEKQKSHEFR